MASSSGNSLPAPEAIQVLVSSLADESPMVKQASMASLKALAPLNPLLVLDCCLTVSRGGRRRFGNIAGVFQVMSIAISALEEGEVDTSYMTKLAKLATAEIISSKEIKADWQRAASSLLVAIGSHLPDLMMEELFLHLSAQNTALPAMVQILADFATSDALQFTPRLKGVLSRVLPILGNVKDQHRPIFANAFRCWCQACWQYSVEYPLSSILDSDVMSFLNSAFELLLQNWATSRDLKVRTSAVEALGQLVGLVTRTLLKASLPKFIPTILELYKKDQDIAFLATCSLHSLLNASLLREKSPPLLDFEDLTVVLSTLLPVVCSYTDIKQRSDFSVGLKTYNEVQYCFLTVGKVYPADLFVFLLSKSKLKEDQMTFGALCVLKHLLPRLSEAWHNKRPALIEAITVLLEEHNLGVRKALAELIVVMASHCYLVGPSGELFVEYLVRHCAMSDQEIDDLVSLRDPFRPSNLYYSFQQRRSEVKIGAVRPTELRAICEKGLLLITITIPEMEHVLWPFMLKMIIPRLYTGAVATVCRCISDMCRNRALHNDKMIRECRTRVDIPRPEELFARLVVLLHNPLAREQLATQILTVLCYLASLFPKNINLFWQDEVPSYEIPKMKAYVSDTEDLKQDLSYQETWDDMIINFLAETLDVVQDTDWIISLGNAFAKQYELYTSDDEHSALLHRCLGILLQKVDNRTYVRDKIDWMYKQANITIPENRLGLAKAMGLVAASHLDTVLDKLKDILDNIGESVLQRFLSFFSDKTKIKDSDDIHAALALMYGYAARYAPSTVIEARIDALVGTNMLSHLLIVRHPSAKQAVITSIDLLGRAVINAAESGISFPLKKRDQLLDYILTLMCRHDEDGFSDLSVELLRTQALALSACTTLVSVDPKLTIEMRNIVMKATLGFFSLPNDPAGAINPLIENLITLLCAILLTSGEDGRSRAEQLLHILKQIDPIVSSPLDYQRKRGCQAVYEMLLKFRTLCVTGYCALGCQGSCKHIKQTDRTSKFNVANLPSAFLLPSRDALCLGERVIVYLPRCADTNSEVRKMSAQILDQFFDISLSLPRPGASVESSYAALSSLEDVIAILKKDTSIDPSEVFNRVISSVCVLLTKDELVATLQGCSVAICDRVKPSAEGGIQAVIEFVTKRGSELNETDISRTAQSLLSATVHVSEKYLRHETLVAISCLAEHTSPRVVFNEVLIAAARDIVTKDILRMPGGWPMQDAFYTFSQHIELSSLFLEHLISTLSRTKSDSTTKEPSGDSVAVTRTEDEILQAAIVALTAFFRGGGKIGKRAVEHNYASVTAILTLHLGSCHSQYVSLQQDQLRILLIAFQAFCECVGDLEMGKILARDGEHIVDEKWIELIGALAGCISIKRPKEVSIISVILSKYLNQPVRFQREAAAAALSEFVRHSSEASGSVLDEIVEALCRHVSDDSPMVRRLCLRGLVQIPPIHINTHTKEILGVILALLDDSDDSVQLTAVLCLLSILESSPNGVENVLLSLCVRLRNLQVSMDTKMRGNAFAAFGALSHYGSGTQRDSFLEQVHAVLPRLILHLLDEEYSVRQACRNTFKAVAPLMEIEDLIPLLNTIRFTSDHRSDYQDFLRDLARQLVQHLASRFDTYMSSIIQAFDAPWPAIQANAIYLSSSMLALTDDQHISASYYYQVFGLLVGKASKSTDETVRATCSSALGMLLKSGNLVSWRAERLDNIHIDSGRSSIDSESSSRKETKQVNSKMVAADTNLHVVMFPLMAQGHMVPMVDIARILALRGATVTIFTTPLVANRFRPVISRASESNLKIKLHEIHLQLSEVGLPEGCESFDILPSFESSVKLFAAIELLEKPAEDLLRGLSPPPSCIISDFCFPWTGDVAQRLNIPRLVFHGPGCFWLLCMHVVFGSKMLEKIESNSERFVVSGLPDRVEFTKPQIIGSLKTNKPDEIEMGFWVRAKAAEKSAYGIVVHTFEELEHEYVKELKKAKDTKVWCIGPVSLCNKDNSDIAERGNKATINEHDCLKWLDGREPGSVVYVCLGSLTRASTQQMIELGLGLESMNKPFIWCVRDKIEELEKWFSEEGFEERVRDRGLIVHGWAPQVLIMSHRAVGGFLTHCGWNSALEAVCAGLPMVTWPHFADQFVNETFIVEILKIGVRIGVESPVPFGEEDKIEVLVKKEDVKKAVECLMDEGEEGKERRKKASELAEMAKRAMEEGGSSYLNILARDGEHIVDEKWIELIGALAGYTDDSPMVRRLCLRELVQIVCEFVSESKGPDFQQVVSEPRARLEEEAAVLRVEKGVAVLGGRLKIKNPSRQMALDSVLLAGGKKTLEAGGFVFLVGGDASLNKGDRKRLKNTLGMIWVKVDVREKILESSPNGVENVLLSLCVRLRNLQVSMDTKMRGNAFAAFGALSHYGSGTQRDSFLEQVHAVLPRLILHLLDEEYSVRQACRNTFKAVAPLMEIEDLIPLLNTTRFTSDHRSDYQDFLRDLARQLVQHLASRFDTYMSSIIQAFDAPWPAIQANAIYLSSSMLALTDDQHISASYYYQVFGLLVGKATDTNLHVVMFPLMAQGHMVPMVDIARILALRGATVTIFTTPLVANRFRPVISRASESNLKIKLHEIHLQLSEVGLPEGCESFDILPSFESSVKLFAAIELLEKPAEDLLRGLSPPPSCIISDFCFPWTGDVAQRLNIPRLVFHGPGCFWLLCMHVVFGSKMLEKIESNSERFVVSGLPDRVEFTKPQITGSLKTNKPDEIEMGFWVRAKAAEKSAYGIVVHTFEELEHEYVKELKKAKDTKVWCIGPVSLCNKDNSDIAERGNKATINEHDCLKWLDGREPGSVVYVCLGSLTRASTQQMIELGLGLESMNKPFIWCVRDKIEELEKWFSEEGFEERVRDRGLIVHGWAPQVLIMSHRAVGGFLTHCGWNSTLEAVCAGLPMVTWPHFADQFINETFIVEILKIGVRIGVESPVPFGEEDKIEVLVKKEDVKKAVECLMDEGEEGKERRKKGSELAEMAKRAMEEGGSSYLNVSSLIQDLTNMQLKT
ncbi:hypothetical protein LXL04_005094 [Taraxacum kok-saghyz]